KSGPLVFWTVVTLVVFGNFVCAQTDFKAYKKNLKQIKQQIDEKQKELEKFKEEEDKINFEISTLKKEDSLAIKKQKELENLLSALRAKKNSAQQKYDSLTSAYQQWIKDLKNEIVKYHFLTELSCDYHGYRNVVRDMILKSVIIEKHLLLSRIKGETVKIHGDIQKLKKRDVELKSQKNLLEKQRSAHKKLVRTKFDELSQTKEKYNEILAEVEKLQNAAIGLNRLVKKLEKQSPYKITEKDKGLPIPKNSLPWPVSGKVISRFGKEYIPLLKTRIVREGIRIQTQEEAKIFPVLSGKVIYAGLFRTYGNVVIIDHEKGFFTVYGLLKDIFVHKNDLLDTNVPIGTAGIDTQSLDAKPHSDAGTLYFEIRIGSDAVDPLIWLQ
ncbi:MAG: peptidoglycan DD-metalloendopeptidase family protein, partial [Elusimicrobiota bacterium]